MEVRVLIFADEATSQKLYTMLKDDDIRIVYRLYDENEVLDQISKTRPDIVLISSNNINLLLRVCQQVYLLRPRSTPVVIIDDYNQEIIGKIIQTGVNYILPLQIDNYTLVAQLKGIYTNESTRLMALESSSITNWKSKVITVFSSKGGVGCTTVATNLAIKLAQKKRKVAILDFDIEFGEVAFIMRVETRNTIAELLQEQPSPNADTIRKYMVVHSSGVNVLAAPSSPEYVEHISVSQTEKIISAIRTHYDYVIIDTNVGFSGINLSCFDASSMILYVTGMDLATLRRTKMGLSILNSLIGNEKVHLLVGKEEPSRVKIRDVSKALEFPLWKSIPFDQKLALEAINQGRPMVLESPLSKVSRVYQDIANEIDESDTPKEDKDKAVGFSVFSKKESIKR